MLFSGGEMKYKENWEETKKKFTDYWKHCNTGRPLMHVVARKPEIEHLAKMPHPEGNYHDQICQGLDYDVPDEYKWTDMTDKYQNPEKLVGRYRKFCETHEFLGESFPNLNVDFGPGSLAAYLGSNVEFSEDNVWFEPCFKDEDMYWEDDIPKLQFDPENEWFKKHLAVVKGCKELAGDDFYIDIPDLMENIDVLASLRDTSLLLMDLASEDEEMEERVAQVTKAYYPAMQAMYDSCKDSDGASAYTVFQIWGPGKCIKLQCDAGAMISPEMFRRFVLPSLKEQAEWGDQVLYHLDGPDNIRHLDAVLECDGISALQWTSGDSGPDGTLPDWDKIYDKAVAKGLSLWIKVYSGETVDDWIKNVDRVVKKYGSSRTFFFFPEMSHDEAVKLLSYAEENWSDVKGTYEKELGL